MKPAGACGQALAGRGTRRGKFAEDEVAKGWGRASAVILRKVPGFRSRPSMKAACPVRRFFASNLSEFSAAAWRIQPAARRSDPAITRCLSISDALRFDLTFR